MAIGDVLKIETSPSAQKISKALAADPTDFIRSTETTDGFFPLIDSGNNAIKIHGFTGESNFTHNPKYYI